MAGFLLFMAGVSASVSAPVPAAVPDCFLARQATSKLVCVSDDDLSTMRGGVALPNGLDVAIAVRSETSINGALLLRSVYRVDTGTPTFQVYAPAVGQSVATTPSASTSNGGSADRANVWVTFDRFNGVAVNTVGAPLPTTVTVTSGAQLPASAGEDRLVPLDLSAGAVDTAGGRVTLSMLPNGERAQIVGDQIDVSHFVGQAFGSFVANTGNDRVIDTTTTISLDLRGATAANIGSAMLRVESIALDAVRQALVR